MLYNIKCTIVDIALNRYDQIIPLNKHSSKKKLVLVLN